MTNLMVFALVCLSCCSFGKPRTDKLECSRTQPQLAWTREKNVVQSQTTEVRHEVDWATQLLPKYWLLQNPSVLDKEVDLFPGAFTENYCCGPELQT